MANKAIRDEAADRANERYPEDFRRNWAYSVAYQELVNRYRKAASRGAVHRGPGSRAEEDERIYWRQVARIVNETLLGALLRDSDHPHRFLYTYLSHALTFCSGTRHEPP